MKLRNQKHYNLRPINNRVIRCSTLCIKFFKGVQVRRRGRKNKRVIQINIKTLTGNIINVDVESTDTIENVKAKVQHNEGIPVCSQQYFYKGKFLCTTSNAVEDNKKLILKNGIVNNSTIYLTCRTMCMYVFNGYPTCPWCGITQSYIQERRGKTVVN